MSRRSSNGDMGSAPSENVVRELEKEAYAALLRAIHIKGAPSDYFVSRTR